MLGFAKNSTRSARTQFAFIAPSESPPRRRKKSSTRASTGADAVEMESAVIQKVGAELGVPTITIRVISDSANESLPLDFNALVDERQNLSFAKLAWKLIGSPGTIPRLISFQKQVKFCGQRLATTLGSFIVSVRVHQQHG